MEKTRGARTMTRVKICGNTNLHDVKLAIELDADYIGFVFAESKRKVDIATVSKIIEVFPNFKKFVGVFLNQPRREVETIAGELGIKMLQFHGEETALYCEYFMNRSYEVIKTFRIKDVMSLKRIDEYNVSSFLFDTYLKDESGGTGIPFDWNLIQDKPFIREKLFLAGGLNIENVRSAIHKIQPYAVDVASGVEKEPGIKDPVLVEKFIRLVKEGTDKNVEKGAIHS